MTLEFTAPFGKVFWVKGLGLGVNVVRIEVETNANCATRSWGVGRLRQTIYPKPRSLIAAYTNQRFLL